MPEACDSCLRRTWLVGRLGGHLDHQRGPIDQILGLEDRALLALWGAVASRRAARHRAGDRQAGETVRLDREYTRFGAGPAQAMRDRAAAAGLELICRCDAAYPASLELLQGPPAVLYVAGGSARLRALIEGGAVAVVGTRRPSAYGVELARRIGRGLSASGLAVVSGMAAGIDADAHRGALAAGGRTVAVLPGCASEPYPKANRRLYGQILESGVAVSELGVGAPVRRWSLLARNRIIAALAQFTLVVQGAGRSGALTTAALAAELGRPVGAVPGSALAPQSEGPHSLLRAGAVLVCGPQDVLDAVYGVGARRAGDQARAQLRPEQRLLLDAIAAGADSVTALERQGGGEGGGGQLLVALAELELAGCVRRAPGGRYVVCA